jgi:hypothetical protein
MLFMGGWGYNLRSFDGKGMIWIFGLCLYYDDGMKIFPITEKLQQINVFISNSRIYMCCVSCNEVMKKTI